MKVTYKKSSGTPLSVAKHSSRTQTCNFFGSVSVAVEVGRKKGKLVRWWSGEVGGSVEGGGGCD